MGFGLPGASNPMSWAQGQGVNPLFTGLMYAGNPALGGAALLGQLGMHQHTQQQNSALNDQYQPLANAAAYRARQMALHQGLMGGAGFSAETGAYNGVMSQLSQLQKMNEMRNQQALQSAFSSAGQLPLMLMGGGGGLASLFAGGAGAGAGAGAMGGGYGAGNGSVGGFGGGGAYP